MRLERGETLGKIARGDANVSQSPTEIVRERKWGDVGNLCELGTKMKTNSCPKQYLLLEFSI